MMMSMNELEDDEDLETPTIVPSYHDKLQNPFDNDRQSSDTNPFGVGVSKENDLTTTNNPFVSVPDITNPFGNINQNETNPFGGVQTQAPTNPFQTQLNNTNPFS